MSLILSTTSIKEVVEEFHDLKTKESEEVFVKKYTLNSQPSILGYVCAIEMKQAQYSYNPISKIKIFKQTKEKLDLLIQLNLSNVHLRYVRLLLQETSPVILGYDTNIEEDKIFLSKILEISDDSDYLDLYIHKNTSL
ncbi:MAG: hypothetical protein P8J69_00790 [Flavobacteriaceae bacterium]|nr:hypothetical protein [Flavobacteriaceae bacterium]